jgi:hypothetical protein
MGATTWATHEGASMRKKKNRSLSIGSLLIPVCAAAGFGCSSSTATTDDAGPQDAGLRPGQDNSSKAFMGTPDPDETAFWNAVLNGDDTGRATTVAALVADVQKDPTNGYSEFLIGCSYFMPPTSFVADMASGMAPSMPFQPNAPAALPFFQNAMQHLTDPFYLGFDGAFLGTIEMQGGMPAAGAQTYGTALMNNPAAGNFIKVIGDLQAAAQGDPQGTQRALADMNTLFTFCNDGTLPSDPTAYVAAQNAGSLAHRECFTGYFAPHGSEGELLVMGDVNALTGNMAAAAQWYAAMESSTAFSAWPLKPLAEGRIHGTQAPPVSEVMGIAATCGTCHLGSLPQ